MLSLRKMRIRVWSSSKSAEDIVSFIIWSLFTLSLFFFRLSQQRTLFIIWSSFTLSLFLSFRSTLLCSLFDSFYPFFVSFFIFLLKSLQSTLYCPSSEDFWMLLCQASFFALLGEQADDTALLSLASRCSSFSQFPNFLCEKCKEVSVWWRAKNLKQIEFWKHKYWFRNLLIIDINKININKYGNNLDAD